MRNKQCYCLTHLLKVLIRIISEGAVVVALLLPANGCGTKSASRAVTEPTRSDGLMMTIVWVGADSGRARYRAGYASQDREEELLAWRKGVGMLPSYFNIAVLNSGEVARLRKHLDGQGWVSLRKPIDNNTWEPHFELRIHDGGEKYRLDIGDGQATVSALKSIESVLDAQERFPVAKIIQQIENR